jgi:uncharacterized protein YbjT (DUF2867 family)
MSKLIVAGATGHVGSVVAGDLLARGDEVTVIVREASKGAGWAARGAKIAVGSLDARDFVASTVKGADGLFTLIPPHYATGDIYAAQRKSADAIAAGVRAGGVPLVVLLSSVGADRPDKNGPIKGLHYAEGKLRESGTKLVAIRSGMFQENLAGAVAAAKQAGIYPSFLGSADIPARYVASRDIGHVVAKVLESPPPTSQVIGAELHRPAARRKDRQARRQDAVDRGGARGWSRRGARAGGGAARRGRGVRRDVRRFLGRPAGPEGRPSDRDHDADRRGAPRARRLTAARPKPPATPRSILR